MEPFSLAKPLDYAVDPQEICLLVRVNESARNLLLSYNYTDAFLFCSHMSGEDFDEDGEEDHFDSDFENDNDGSFDDPLDTDRMGFNFFERHQ